MGAGVRGAAGDEAFGFWKVTVERSLRLTVELSQEHRDQFRVACQEAKEDPLANLVDRVAEKLGPGPHRDFNVSNSLPSGSGDRGSNRENQFDFGIREVINLKGGGRM